MSKVMDSATQQTGDSLELLREREYPFYKPAEGVGSSVKSEVITNKTPSTIQTPSYFPPFGSNRAGHAHGNNAETAAATASSSSAFSSNLSTPNNVGSGGDAPPSTAGLATPSTNFGYSPYVQEGRGTPAGGSSTDAAISPDWLPSPVVEEREDQLSPATSRVPSNLAGSDALNQQSLDAHMDALALDGIQVVPSATSASVTGPAAVDKEVGNSSSSQAQQPLVNNAATISAIASTAPSAAAVNPSTTPAAPLTSPSTASSTANHAAPAPVRPAAPEHKKSVFGKLFSHGHKDKHDTHSGTSSPVPTAVHDHNESSTTAQPSQPVRMPSGSATSTKDKEHHSSISNFLNRRGSNKKMAQPDPALIAMAKNNPNSTVTSPNGSSAGLPTTAGGVAGGLSSTAASRGSTPDVNGLPPPPMSNRGVSASPSRAAGTSTPGTGEAATTGGRPMARRPSGSTMGHSDTEGGRKQGYNGTYTPTGEQHQVKEKSLKEHLAALGTSTGGMMGKMTRKTSQTSKRSDDGRSEKSVGGYYQEEDVTAAGASSAYPAMPSQPKRAPSQSGQSNASTSLLQKYGVCEKVAIGKGATAVVRLAHKWDRSTEKLYAVKEFRKRRKNESEKEYVKKLTSEFCISSTLHHINVVETVDLVQNEEKHWCEVMEYCPGGDLYAAIKKGTMTTGEINIYFKQIVTGVAYLHSMGVAHRDIKPENLLLDNQGHVKITDFGISDVFRMCWEKQTHMSKGLCGSEPYIAPEQFEQKEYDARLVDVWACAVVFYCMQAQELPWRVAKSSDPSFASYLQYYPASQTPPPLGNLHPKECRSVIKKMLDPNPKARIGMEAVLADPFLKSIEYDAPASAPAPLMQ